MGRKALRLIRLSLGGVVGWLAIVPLAAAAGPAAGDFDTIPYATWDEREPEYRLYPGDEVELAVPSAPELNKTLIVQPDGRISPPLLQPVMVADLTLTEAADKLSRAYSQQLLRPAVNLNIKTTAPIRVFVGGQVDKPGVYEMVGDMNAAQALIMAGGPRTSARGGEAIVIRRGANGTTLMRRVDLGRALRAPGSDAIPLRRMDIIYVPRSRISSLGELMAQLRALLPFQFTFSLSPTFRGY